MKVGDYVRVKSGTLWKPETFYDTGDTYIFDEFFEYSKDEVKTSPNIIDLIEVGDYVNGRYVEYTSDEAVFFGRLDYERDIKSIVTKEQFESMKYKV